MIINLKKSISHQFQDVEVSEGIVLEDLVKRYAEELPHKVYIAKVDNVYRSLAYTLDKPCKVEFFDLRNQAANLTYQRSLIYIFLRAVEEVLGKGAKVSVENPLNKGLYIDVYWDGFLEIHVKEIEKHMRKIVSWDLPFEKVSYSKAEAETILEEAGLDESRRLIDYVVGDEELQFNSLDGREFFLGGYTVPSTGYVQEFELRNYKGGMILRFPQTSSPDAVAPYKDEKVMYNAYENAKNWQALTEVTYLADLLEKNEEGKMKELIMLSEALHQKQIVEIADEIVAKGKRVILIAGPSSSGKTTFAKRLCLQLRVNGLKPLYMGTDDYFVDREFTPVDENGEYDFENLDAMDIELFNQNMNDLLEGKEVDMPEFDFVEGKKIFGKRITKIDDNQPIVIEGIHALNEAFSKSIKKKDKFKIYISPLVQLSLDRYNRFPSTEARMLRRMVRDYNYRGRSAQGTLKEWPKVRAGENKNIFPYSGEADAFFNTVHVYELCVLKKYAQPLLEAIKPDEPEYGDALRMLQYLRFFKVWEDDSIIPNDSIIREFIGGSIYVD